MTIAQGQRRQRTPKASDAKQIEAVLAQVHDESSFIQKLLIDTLDWPIDPKIKTVEEITYDWTKDELHAANLDKKVAEGRIRQLALPDCPWGIFIVEFKTRTCSSPAAA